MADSSVSSGRSVSYTKGWIAAFSVFILIFGTVLSAFYDTFSRRMESLERVAVTKREFDLFKNQRGKFLDLEFSRIAGIEDKLTKLITDPSLRVNGFGVEDRNEFRSSIQGILKNLVETERRLTAIEVNTRQVQEELTKLRVGKDSSILD